MVLGIACTSSSAETRVVILLCGGDKRSQDRDIARALELAREV